MLPAGGWKTDDVTFEAIESEDCGEVAEVEVEDAEAAMAAAAAAAAVLPNMGLNAPAAAEKGRRGSIKW